jgi:hypothetical protein
MARPMRTAAPGNSNGTLKQRSCAVCTRKRLTLMFRGPLAIHNGWIDKSFKVAVCDECIRSAYGDDRVEREIAMGRLSFKSRRPPPQAVQVALFTEEEK